MADFTCFEEADPFSDAGRRDRILELCILGGVPCIGMYLFETGASPEIVLAALARSYGVSPVHAPFPDLIVDPFPRDDD